MDKKYKILTILIICLLVARSEIIKEDRCNMGKEIRGRVNSKYSFKDGKCERYYFFEFRPSGSYFDTKEECVAKCISKK